MPAIRVTANRRSFAWSGGHQQRGRQRGRRHCPRCRCGCRDRLRGRRGGRRAAIGGATGLLAGSAIGANNAAAAYGGVQQAYDVNYTQCMIAPEIACRHRPPVLPPTPTRTPPIHTATRIQASMEHPSSLRQSSSGLAAVGAGAEVAGVVAAGVGAVVDGAADPAPAAQGGRGQITTSADQIGRDLRTVLVRLNRCDKFSVRPHQVQHRAMVHRVVVRSRTGTMLGVVNPIFPRHIGDLLL